jgi:hypothetical protein
MINEISCSLDLSYANSLQCPPGWPIPLLPLNDLGRRFRVDFQAQILKADGLMPTVYPPEFFGLEFTGKFPKL